MSSFHHCGCLLKLVQACFMGRKDGESNFHDCGCAEKLVQACLNARKDGKSSFHHCGGLACEAGTSLFK